MRENRRCRLRRKVDDVRTLISPITDKSKPGRSLRIRHKGVVGEADLGT